MVPLESSRIFENLSPAEMAGLRAATEQRSYSSGQAIFREGDDCDGVYVVQEGEVEISVVVGSEGERKVFAREGEGALFGEIAMVDNQPRSASAIATRDSVILFIPRDKLTPIMEKSPRFTRRLIQGITRRLREFNHQYVDEVIQTERLALVGRFTRSIVHDLKNPLNIIGIAADMATHPKSTPEMQTAARDRIRKQINRISNLVNEVVEFTRNTNTAFVLAMVDFDRLILQTVDDLRSEMTLRGVKIVFKNDPPAVKLALNPERLARVIYNLFVNASDAMPEGGTLTLSFEQKDNRIVTTIADDGPGIPDAIRDKLFNAFVTHGKQHGTGLGLSICRRIVEDHHGQMWADNLPEGGAAFTFTLPVPKGGS